MTMRRLVWFTCALACACSPAPPPPTEPAASASRPAPLRRAATAAGPRAESEAYQVELEAPAEALAGRPASARLTVKARGPYHVNRDYPTSFRPEVGAVAAFGGEKLALDRAARTPCAAHPAEDCALTAPLSFTVRDVGAIRLAGTVAFSVCDAERCLIEKVPLAAALEVKAAAPGAAPATSRSTSAASAPARD